MASSIIATTIDESFPVAGVDNDSQGFRDNFSIIKDNFTYAKDEIETLQNDTAKKNVDNSFDNNTISLANLKEITHEFNGSATGDGDRTLSFTNGHFWYIDDVSVNITVTCIDWPTTDQYAEMHISVKPIDSSQPTVTFAGQNPSGTPSTYLVDDKGDIVWTGRTLTLDIVNTKRDLIKVYTFDGGNSLYIQYLGRFTQTA